MSIKHFNEMYTAKEDTAHCYQMIKSQFDLDKTYHNSVFNHLMMCSNQNDMGVKHNTITK